jgi:Ca2+-binding EF-hand superfamily protein
VLALREQIALERELEDAKIRLVHRHDFNLFDAFRVFDQDDRGSITFHDIKYGLNDIGVSASNEEIELYIARYDLNKDNRIRFTEFC